MTTLAIELDRARSSSALRRARTIELLATGGITFVVFPLAWALRAVLGLDTAELAVGFVCFHAAHVINDPHFAVTYLLFYRDARARLAGRDASRAQHVRWLLAGVAAPLALVAWAAWAIGARHAQALGWMAQLMYLLVGWHYAKQGFGAAIVLAARRGVRFAKRERDVLLAHAYAAWAFAWASPATVAGELEEKGVVFWAPARPAWLELGTGVVLAVSTIALVAVLAARWRRERTLPYGPLACFLVTIWIFTIATSLDPLVRYVIPALHSIQYLYFVWLVRRNEARTEEGPPLFRPPPAQRVAALAIAAIALGWALFRGAPALLDPIFVARSGGPRAVGDLGATPFFAAFYVVVNIHHFVMDSVLWRRESPWARFLSHDPPATRVAALG